MAEILKEWLSERLQQPITWETHEFGTLMRDGHVIAGVLLSYHVIDEDKNYLIKPSTLAPEIQNNWKHLSQWLREIDVTLSEEEIRNLAEGKGPSLLRLFYQLFLHLDRRDRTNFIKRERKMASALVEKMENRFKVEKVDEERDSFVDNLSRPLLNEKHLIEWQKKKSEKVKETHDYMRYRFRKLMEKLEESRTPLKHELQKPKKLTSKEKIDMEQFAIRYPCKYENYTYEELMALDEKAAERRKSILDTEWANNYLINLHTKMNNRADSEEFQKQMRAVLSKSIWDMSVEEEETKFDTELAKKVLKLSQFEKQMCTQLMETKQQVRNMVQNKIQAEKEFAEQREHQFDLFLDNVKEQISAEVTEVDFEKRRHEILHKRLYAEKMKRKRQHYYEICYETMLSIVDYATKYAYHKLLLDDDIPEHYISEWKKLFYTKQPIFDLLDPMEDLLKENAIEEEPEPEIEEINKLEMERQDALNEEDFIEYHNYIGPWNLDTLIPNYDNEAEERKFEYLGNRILGHVVFTLLEIKYPYPPRRQPADLPDFPVKAFIRGLPDRSITTAMQTLLNNQKIHVSRTESAINYCLKQFKAEMVGCIDIELSYDKFMGIAQEDDSKELIRLMKVEEDASSKTTITIGSIIGPVPPNAKITQTPKTIPEEEITLSQAAELGRYAYESLSFGESLTDFLLSSMVVEYLKGQNDINGFVIINYPNCYREAQTLEEIFSGRAPPNEEDIGDSDDIYLEESIVKHRRKEKDEYVALRISRLVNDPHKKRVEPPFQSYFTCYIKLKETEDILQELVIWELNKDNSEFIDRFYAILGINYSMYYEFIEKELLAQICQYIIGDLELPIKNYDELFGEHVLSTLDFPSTEDKRQKNKILKPEVSGSEKSKDRLKRGSKSSKSTVIDVEVVKAQEYCTEVTDEAITILEPTPRKIDSSISGSKFDVKGVEEVKLLAGEEDWNYGELPISEILGIALATCWEEVEKSYINDMEQLFFANRLLMNSIIPYTRFVKDKMHQIITLPSRKQDLVIAFQTEYNEFEHDWREINLTKAEWHCRVRDLQKQLYNICDKRKLFAEQQRQSLIQENWAMDEMTCLVNTYISCMQTELNRFIMTYQSMHDFYFTMLKRLPPTDRLSSKDLSKILRDSDDTSLKKSTGEDKLYKQLKAAFIDLQLKNITIDYTNNPMNMVLENNVKFALKTIKDINDSYRSIISREYSEVAKIVIPTKKKDEASSQESISPEEIMKENMLKCVEEWTMGINGEMYRVNLRVLALQYKCYYDMKLFNDQIYKTFVGIQDYINTYYANEIKSVDQLCKYIQIAIEDGRCISESLILENDVFVIDTNLLQYRPPAPPAPQSDDGIDLRIDFSMSQLERLRNQFKICAPTGLTVLQTFIYLVQDFIFFGKETCEGPLFPEVWKRVNPDLVPKLVYNIFGMTAFIDWRDFLIMCLNLNVPTIDQILRLRRNLRCDDPKSTELISRQAFMEQIFWFEQDFDPEDYKAQLRKNEVKNFLFDLFETSPDFTNYSAFLLSFCKSKDPIEGFAMALSVAVGKPTCLKLEECEEVVCKLVEDKMYRDACLACAHKCVNQFLETVLSNVMQNCEGVFVTEMEYIEPAVTTKGKKGTGKQSKKEGGKKEGTQSAREPVKPRSPTPKNKAQSETDVKVTYICPPCQVESEEKLEQQLSEHVEEEHVESIKPDPNLVYAVSQSVIWNVLRSCMPWHFSLVPTEKKTPYVDQVNEVIKKYEVYTDNGDIYVCKFVNHPNICKILHEVKKFTSLNLTEEVSKICES